MKTTLQHLTVAQFVDILCGDLSHLNGHTDKVKAARDIVMEYRELTDGAGFKSYIMQNEELAKAKIEMIVFGMCANLCQLQRLDLVREVLDGAEIRYRSRNDTQLAAEVKMRFNKAKSTIEKNTGNTPDDAEMTPEQIRRGFDSQTAALMAHFKFQIDSETMKATLYAHLVARLHAEIKAQQAALKR